jgi:epoxyqueuosine reductase
MEERDRPAARAAGDAVLDPSRLAARAKALALAEGFDLAGVASADAPAELGAFARWVSRGYAGEMSYLTSQVARRSDLRAAFPWARSLLCVGLQYDTPHAYSIDAPEGRGWIARYAWGDDYHDVMKDRLDAIVRRLGAEIGSFLSKTYADTGPIVERAFAAAAGLGAWGKNTCLLHPDHGSWFFLGEVVTDLEMESDEPRPDMCGSCTACLDACPTDALPEPFVLDASRCISYLTIETKGAIPEPQREGVGRHVFGCDICQDVCPWNRKRRERGGSVFEPRPGLVAPDLDSLASLVDPAAFAAAFRRSPVKRARRRGFLRNVAVALGNSGDVAHRPALERLATDADPVVSGHALWALGRLGGPHPRS